MLISFEFCMCEASVFFQSGNLASSLSASPSELSVVNEASLKNICVSGGAVLLLSREGRLGGTDEFNWQNE